MNMKPDPEIVVTFDEESVIVETIGFEGSSCVKATADILTALGAKDVKRQIKAEYNQGPVIKKKTERIRL